jgi:phosphatidylserine/phosphatidylglycerophosphate/cardiolipin synthase-like enzyme
LERVTISLAPGKTFSDIPPVRLLSTPHIADFMTMLLGRAKKTIYAKQYSMDHTEAFSMLENAVRKGVRIKLVHDRDKFEHPSCVMQNDRLRNLAEHARELGRDEYFQLRTMKPKKYGGGGFNSQHSKTWILDDEIYVDGSANLTGQAMKNQESIIVTRDLSVLEDALTTFSEVWSEADEVTYDRLLNLPERASSSSRYGRSASVSIDR